MQPPMQIATVVAVSSLGEGNIFRSREIGEGVVRMRGWVIFGSVEVYETRKR